MSVTTFYSRHFISFTLALLSKPSSHHYLKDTSFLFVPLQFWCGRLRSIRHLRILTGPKFFKCLTHSTFSLPMAMGSHISSSMCTTFVFFAFSFWLFFSQLKLICLILTLLRYNHWPIVLCHLYTGSLIIILLYMALRIRRSFLCICLVKYSLINELMLLMMYHIFIYIFIWKFILLVFFLFSYSSMHY